MSVSQLVAPQHLVSPMIKAVVIYDDINGPGGNEVIYETEYMESEVFYHQYPRSIKSFDCTFELDSLLYGLDEHQRDPEMVRIKFYKMEHGVETLYEYDPRSVNEDEEA